MLPNVTPFFHTDSCTWTYVVADPATRQAAIIDPVLDFEPAGARTSTVSADRLLERVRQLGLRVEWNLETHAHADHLSAAAYLQEATGAKVAIGRGITAVQARFRDLFDLGAQFGTDGSQFDRLLDEGDELRAGELTVRVLETPGHTPDGLTYLVGDAAFVGDTLFAPETGTARADFPGGDARVLFRSIRRILALPAGTRIFLCHDYPPSGREPRSCYPLETHRLENVHVSVGTDEEVFVHKRQARDATLGPPRLILPALQVNIQAGRLPAPGSNGIRYLRIPLNQFGTGI